MYNDIQLQSYVQNYNDISRTSNAEKENYGYYIIFKIQLNKIILKWIGEGS